MPAVKEEVVSMPVSPKDLSVRLSKRLASFELGDEVIERLVDRAMIDGLNIGRIDPCIYGICIDYWTTELPPLDKNLGRAISKWEVFPYGIIEWDMFRVRVAFEVDELESRLSPRGFHG
jgi:hypothetical protein